MNRHSNRPMYFGIIFFQMMWIVGAVWTMVIYPQTICFGVAGIAAMMLAMWNMIKPLMPYKPSRREVRRVRLFNQLWALTGAIQSMHGRDDPDRAEIEALIKEIKADPDFAYTSLD